MNFLHFWRSLALVLLSVSLLSGCQSSATSKKAHDIQEAIRKAEDWESKQAFLLVEAEARKALALEPENKKAKYLLFVGLKGQDASPERDQQSQKLASELIAESPKESPETKAATAYLEELSSRTVWKELTEAYESKSDKAVELLEKIPGSRRDATYWQMAYEVHQRAKNEKKSLEAARTWMTFEPQGRLAQQAKDRSK